jgi:cytochrome P450
MRNNGTIPDCGRTEFYMTITQKALTLPFDRPSILQVAPLFRELQADQPIVSVRTPAGDPAWLVTRYADIRELLDSPKLGRGHPDPEHAPRFSEAEVFGVANRGDSKTEASDHARRRKVMSPWFTPRRIARLRPGIQAMVEELLDGLADSGPVADFREAFSYPLPAQTICLLLGVPWADRHAFRQWSDGAVDLTDRTKAMAAFEKIRAYMRQLIDAKRAEPGDDVISDLIRESDKKDGRLSEDEVAYVAAGLLYAGHETTTSLIDFGALLLLTHPEQKRLLIREPSLVASAVEEILRAAAPSPYGVLPRYVHETVEVAGQVIEAGEMVLLAIETANQDERVFSGPRRFDIRRQGNPHIAFGHGPRFCLGASLARVELQATFGALFRRFPHLSLAVPVEQLTIRDQAVSGGLSELPVSW